jgi:hypothetical protein
MHRRNFCAECGARLARKGWRVWIGGRICDACERRLGKLRLLRPLFLVAILALAAFVLGRYLRPKPPPLIVQRAANSPLSDLPVDLSDAGRSANRNPKSQNAAAQIDENASTGQPSSAGLVDDVIYICGARTKKGTPCKRRVQAAGERCYQHKGMPAILPLEKLSVKR